MHNTTFNGYTQNRFLLVCVQRPPSNAVQVSGAQKPSCSESSFEVNAELPKIDWPGAS